MQGEIAEDCGSQVGLRSLNQRVQDVSTPPRVQLSSVPPVVMLDAIWLSLLEKTGEQHIDRLKRQRPAKSRRKVCVLVALGLYPQTGHWGVLDWQLAQSESQSAWEALLLPLEARGLYPQRGLELFIHDGGKGLIAALNLLYPNIPHQRCLFHKLRNLWHSIQVPKNLPAQDARTFKRALLQEAQSIFYAQTTSAASERRDQFIQNYRQSQFDFVTSLERDWPETMAFFRVLKRFPSWRRSALRTTSLLERLNRNLRRLFRSAGAFHSISGLLATVARVLNPKRLI
jgi:transposase-like protein